MLVQTRICSGEAGVGSTKLTNHQNSHFQLMAAMWTVSLVPTVRLIGHCCPGAARQMMRAHSISLLSFLIHLFAIYDRTLQAASLHTGYSKHSTLPSYDLATTLFRRNNTRRACTLRSRCLQFLSWAHEDFTHIARVCPWAAQHLGATKLIAVALAVVTYDKMLLQTTAGFLKRTQG